MTLWEGSDGWGAVIGRRDPYGRGANPFYDWDEQCPAVSPLCGATRPSPPHGQPPQKSYKDFNTGWPLNSWSVTENSNGYQSAYIRLLARYVHPPHRVAGPEATGAGRGRGYFWTGSRISSCAVPAIMSPVKSCIAGIIGW